MRRSGWAVLAAALLLTGCADLQTGRLLESPGDLPPRARVSGVPFYPQEESYCGPASLAMVLSWSGQRVSQEEVAPTVFTPSREGSFRTDVLGAARRKGRLAVSVRGMRELLAELAGGHPVLVFQNLGLSWIPRWHYAVAIGYDLGRETVVLHTGTREARPVAMDTFERTWARADYWGAVVLPPGELPATAQATPVLEAAVALENLGRLGAAETVYASATERWPGRLGAWIGLANARYARGEKQEAERALRSALERHPRAAEVWNNLAVVLSDLGQSEEAVRAAKKAVRLGGGDDRYRRTLREVSGKDSPAAGRR